MTKDIEIGTGARRPIAMRRVRSDGWNKTVRRQFLATLAETCNVRMAVAACGKRNDSAYRLRKRDPEFADLWQEALEIGYERLEAALLAHALTTLNAIDVGENRDEIAAELAATDAPGAPDAADARHRARTPEGKFAPRHLTPSDVQVALAILNRHRASVEGRRTPMRTKRRRTAAETDALLRLQLDRLAAKLARDDARAAVANGGKVADEKGGVEPLE